MATATLSEIKAQIGIPESSQFLGYVVHVPSTDEFLAEAKEGGGVSFRAFVKGPELAQRYSEYDHAHRRAGESKKPAEVGLLFDTGSQFIYAPVND